MISPGLAEEILAHDPRNRKERKGDVARYARLMLGGKWNPAISEALMFLPNGRLANGQHRLWILNDETLYRWARGVGAVKE